MDLGNNRDEIFKKIYEETYSNSYALALSMVKKQDDALDILQDAYIKVYNKLDTVREEEKVNHWVCKVVSNTCKDWLKKKKNVVFSDIDGDNEDSDFQSTIVSEYKEFNPDESMDYSETKRLIGNILDELPENQKMCVLLHYYEELNVTEIAQVLECSEGTVKSRLNYARNKIKVEVEALERKGTKLYSVAPIPFIIWMLKDVEISTGCQLSKGTVLEGVQKCVVNGGLETVASKNVAGKNVASKGAIGKSAAGSLVAKKIIIGIVSLSLVAGGIVGIPKLMDKTPDNPKDKDKAVMEISDEEILKAYTDYFKEKKEQVKGSYTSYNENGEVVSEKDLCSHIMDSDGDKVPEYICYGSANNGDDQSSESNGYKVSFSDGAIEETELTQEDLETMESDSKDKYQVYEKDGIRLEEFYVNLRDYGINAIGKKAASYIAYDSVLAKYKNQLMKPSNYGPLKDMNDRTWGDYPIDPYTLENVGYKFVDINKDGIDELIIGEINDVASTSFSDAYYFNDGKVISMRDENYPATDFFYILNDAIRYERESGGFNGMIQYKKIDKGGKLYISDCIGQSGRMPGGKLIKTDENGNSVEITEEEFNKIYDSYGETREVSLNSFAQLDTLREKAFGYNK